MYTEHFGLNEKPFSISPDPRYLYMSQRHADALAHLVFGISESGGFIQLTGEVGTGKTTLIRSLLGRLPDKTEIALILNPQLSTKQFLQAICTELHVPFAQRDTAKGLIDKLNERLLALHAENRRVVLIVDEAQTMSPALLEQVRLLTNLETEKQKLLQIILIGQPELREVLSRPEMRQIAQRITGRYHLEPLDGPDTAIYVAHRMRVAGGRPEIFSKRAVRKLYRLSRGLPRLINIIADRSLLAAYARDENLIGASLVGKAADEVFGRTRSIRWWPWAAGLAGITVLLLVSAIPEDRDAHAVLELAVAEPARIEAPAPDVTDFDVPTSDGSTTGSPTADMLATEAGGLAEIFATARASNPETTLEALFSQWLTGEAVPAGNACQQAEAVALRCMELNNPSLSELRQLNRPAMLEWAATDGTARHLLLLALDDNEATVWTDGAVTRIAAAELEQATFTRSVLVFRPAISESNTALSEGERGPSVIWLRASLESLADARIPAAEPDLFDSALADAVRDFQRAHGLPADGRVGDPTLARLQAEIGLIGVPLHPGMN